MTTKTLYERLGGYDAIAAVVNELLPRLQSDEKLARFWQNRGTDGVVREKQLLVDFLAHVSGGPIYYTGRSMTKTHAGMGIDEQDWQNFIGHVKAVLAHFAVPETETGEVLSFIESLKAEVLD